MSRLLAAQRAWTVPGWVKDLLWRRAQAIPSLDLRFADNKSLTDAVTGASLVTFTRASTATFINSAGVLQTAATDVPRFDHNPTTGESLGLLVEEQRTNQHLQSGNLYGYGYTVFGTGDVLTNSYGTGADGVANKTLRVQTGATSRVLRWVSADCGIDAISTQYCISFFYRGVLPLSVSARAGANIAPVVIFPPTGTSMGRAYAAITSGVNGAAFIDMTILFNTDCELWGVQVEKNASFPTSYIPTTTAAATRSADVASITGANFGSWYNSSNTFSTYCEYVSVDRPIGVVYFIGDATDTNRALQLYEGIGSSLFEFNTNPTISFNTTRGTSVKTAFGRLNGNNTGVVNGAIAGTSAGSVSVLPDRLYIGGNAFYSNRYLSSTIKRLTYWPQRLPGSTLEALTKP